MQPETANCNYCNTRLCHLSYKI